MAFSIRLVNANVSFTSSISAVTGLKLSNTSSTCCLSAIGCSLLRICSSRSLMFTLVMLRSAADLSIFTSESRSLMIFVSLSISFVISPINSLYISTGASSPIQFIESASTFMDVRGVFNSCETFDTNSCLDSSITFIPAISSLKF